MPAATIPVETIDADVVVTGGGDDQLWPSDEFAAAIAARRRAAGRATRLVVDPAAGHGVRLPGEPHRAPSGFNLARGGGAAADAAIGALVWPHVVDVLRLDIG